MITVKEDLQLKVYSYIARINKFIGIPLNNYVHKCTHIVMANTSILYGGKLWQWENLANSLQKVIGGIKFGKSAMYVAS